MDWPGFRGKLIANYPLAPHTTWKVGGAADFFAIPEDLEDLCRLLTLVKARGLPLFVLGRGSNVLIDDAGFRGVVVQLGPALSRIERQADTLRVGAGVPMPMLARYAATCGFGGFEHMIGIPGTIGAGIVINAGKGTDQGADMRGRLKTVTYLDDELQIVSRCAERLDLGYRSSRLNGTRAIVVDGAFTLNRLAPHREITERHRAILAERRRKFPLHLPNAGSVFKRPTNGRPAGYLVETAGLKSLQIGQAQVSPQHANFIVNLGMATSADIRALIDVIQQRVFDIHGIALELEIVMLPNEPTWP